MEEEVSFINDEFIKIRRLIENEIDNLLPESYAYIQRKAESYLYSYNIEIDPYEIRGIANRAYSRINNSWLNEAEDIISIFLNKSLADLEMGNDIMNPLQIFSDEMDLYIKNDLTRLTRNCTEMFVDEIIYEYSRKFGREKATVLAHGIGKQAEQIMEESISFLQRKVATRTQEMIQEYVIIHRNNPVNNEEKKKAQQGLIDYLKEIEETNREAINNNQLVKEKFLSLVNFIKYILNNDIDPRKLDINASIDFEHIKNELSISLKEYENKKNEELLNKEIKEEQKEIDEKNTPTIEPVVEETANIEQSQQPKHFAPQREVVEGPKQAPKHFAKPENTTPKPTSEPVPVPIVEPMPTVEQGQPVAPEPTIEKSKEATIVEAMEQIDFIKSMETVSEEHKQLLINQILENYNLTQDDIIEEKISSYHLG